MCESVAVMVHAIEARDLRPKKSCGMIDPVLCIEVFGKRRFTPKFSHDLAPYFNHYFHVESDKVRDFASETLVISVFDTGTLTRKILIGSFSFELAEVYKQPNHEYFRVWTVLTSLDATGKSVVGGYLRLSVTVLRPGDTPVQHNEPDDDETDGGVEDLSKMQVLLKHPGLDGINNVLRAKVLKAEHLPKMDTFGTVDPYVEIKFGTNVARTSTIKRNYNPQWLEEIQIPVNLPDNMFFKVLNFNSGSAPELIAQKIIGFKEIQTTTGKNWAAPNWINLYRGTGSQGELTDYAGRVLASFSVIQAEPKLCIVKTCHEPEPLATMYTIAFDLYEIQGLNKGEYYVVVSIGNHKVTSSHKEKADVTGLVEFYENIPDLDVVFPQDTSQIPDIYVYIYTRAWLTPGGDKRIGYLKYTYQQFSQLGANPKWEAMKRKCSSSQLADNFNVSILFRASISTQKAQRLQVIKPSKTAYQLRAHIYLGSNLRARDEDALSDPYLTVTLGGVRATTKVQEHTIYPDWYETLLLDIELPENCAPNIAIDVFDCDVLSSDFLGRVNIPLPNPTTSSTVPEPQWYRLFLNDQISGSGEILASFQLFPADRKSIPVPQIIPSTIEAEIDLVILGISEMSPFRLLPVSNPFVECSIGGKHHTVQTRPAQGRNGNANFFEKLRIITQLPEDGKFIPALLVEVFDKRALGNVLVGTVSVHLSSFAPWVPQDQRAPLKYVTLPPIVHEDKFYQPPKCEPLTTTPVIDDKQDQQYIVCAEEEEPPQPPQLPSEIEHSFKQYPFVELDLFRGIPPIISSWNLRQCPDTVSGKVKLSIAIRHLPTPQPTHTPAFSPPPLLPRSFPSHSPLLPRPLSIPLPRPLPLPVPSPSPSPPTKLSCYKSNDNAVDVTQVAKLRPYVLRVYIETGHNLVPHDTDGSASPYLVLSIGRQIIKDEESLKEKTLQPEFYKMYTFQGTLPEENQLTVEMFDKDTIGSDEFMGRTDYDLESLWFSDEWRKMNPKPKEFRTLWHNSSTFPQGKLKMWIELMSPEEAATTLPYPIAPPRKQAFEMRIIIWDTRNVVSKDNILAKGSSDQFVVTKLINHPDHQQQTDVHDSVMDGCGKFNWRIVYSDIMLPYDVPQLKVQVFDKDHMAGHYDAIAESNLNLKGFFQKALRNGSAKISIEPDLFHPSFEGVQGTINMELELLTREEALKNSVGRGRESPNQNPFLPEPVRPKREWFSDAWKNFRLGKVAKYVIIAGLVCGFVMVQRRRPTVITLQKPKR